MTSIEAMTIQTIVLWVVGLTAGITAPRVVVWLNRRERLSLSVSRRQWAALRTRADMDGIDVDEATRTALWLYLEARNQEDEGAALYFEQGEERQRVRVKGSA